MLCYHGNMKLQSYQDLQTGIKLNFAMWRCQAGNYVSFFYKEIDPRDKYIFFIFCGKWPEHKNANSSSFEWIIKILIQLVRRLCYEHLLSQTVCEYIYEVLVMWNSEHSWSVTFYGTTVVGTMIFRDRGKRTENAESTIGNGKHIFKRKNT